MLSTIAISTSGGYYDAAAYIPAVDVMVLGLSPGITRQSRLGWVVWESEHPFGYRVRGATTGEIEAETARLRARDLERRRKSDPDAEEDPNYDPPVYCAHQWKEDVSPSTTRRA